MRALRAALDQRDASPEDVKAVREFVSRSIRRLNVLEVVILGAAVGIALLGGWLGALIASSAFGLPMRTTWMVLSVVLFVVPGALALTRDRRKRPGTEEEPNAAAHENPGGGHDG